MSEANVTILPPESEAEKQEALSLVQEGETFVIRTDADYELTAEKIRKCDAILKGKFLAQLDDTKKKAKATWDSAVTGWKALHDPVQAMKDKYLRMRTEYASKKELAAAKLRADQIAKDEAKRKKEADELAARLKKTNPQAAAQVQRRVAQYSLAPPPTTPAVPQTKGFVTRDVALFEVVNPDEVPDKYWTLDESKIAADVKTFGMQAAIPGVIVWMGKKEHTRG